MQMKKKVREEKAIMSIYATVVLISFLFLLMAIYFTIIGVRKAQLKTNLKIKQSYEMDSKNIDAVYQAQVDKMGPAQREFLFAYTGSVQTFTAPADGRYKIEAWGAQGNNAPGKRSVGGLGAYTKGEVSLKEGDVLYVYVGEHRTDRSASFNAGTTGGNQTDASNGGGVNGYGGGGATDIRTNIGSSWDELESIKSRIMVAGGGGGGSDYAFPVNGGYGGALTGGNGYNGKNPSAGVPNTPPTGGTQTAGGAASKLSTSGGNGTAGIFAKGGNGDVSWGSAGGGGYYGGGGGGYTGNSVDSGAGGSSFISGHIGCNSVSPASTNASAMTHTGTAFHYSGLKFSDTVMKAGNETMPTHDGQSTMTGNEGNGYAKITWAGRTTTEELDGKYAYVEDFDSWANYGVSGTTMQSCTNGILTLKSTNTDPMVHMNNVTSFNTAECRYLEVRYKTSSANAKRAEFFMIENPTNQNYAISQTIIADGQWHTLTIDLWSNANVKNRGTITGWRWDWIDNTNVTMEIDYVKVLKIQKNEDETYVSNGLIAYYDGIDNTGGGHSATATSWKDLSGNGKDIATLKGTINANNLQLTGSQVMNIPISGNFKDMTVEITVSNLEQVAAVGFQIYGSYERLLSTHLPWSDNAIYFDASHDATGYQRISKTIDFDKTGVHTLTFRKSTTLGESIYVDGKLWIENTSFNRAVGNVTGGTLGEGHGDLATSFMKGKIHSFRIYQVGLVQDEITNNYEMDKARFGI